MGELVESWPLCTCWVQQLPTDVARRLGIVWPVLFVEHCLIHGRQAWAARLYDHHGEAPR